MGTVNTLNRSVKRKILFSALAYIVFVISFAYLNVVNERQALYQQFDRQLEEATNTIKLILPSSLHNRSMTQHDQSAERSYANTRALSELTDSNDISHIYTLIQHDNKILFTSSSATAKQRAASERLNFYFQHYDDVDPRIFDIFAAKEKMILQYSDHRGTFRSIFIPSYSVDGTFYLSVASLPTSHIVSLVNEQIYHSVFIALLLLLFVYPLYHSAMSRLKDDTKQLNDKLQGQASAFKDSQNKLVKNQRALLELAKESFIDHTEALNKIVSVAADQLDVARVSIWLFNTDRTASICQVQYSDGEISTDQNAIDTKDYPRYFDKLSDEGFISADDVNSHPDTSEFLDGYTENLGISSMLDTPIYSGGDVIGLSCFEHTGPQRQWSKEDEEFARSISDLCSQVFINEQRKKAEKLLSQQAHYDELTKLPNRVLFADRFSQAVARSKRSKKMFAICFLDLDNFKPINDTFGHDVGDQVLVEVAQRIQKTIRDEDTVSRQGGDEFTLLLGDIQSYEYCEHVLNRLSFALQQPYLIANHSHEISASIGATLYPADDADLDTLIRHADHAMYQAKLAGKNQHCFFNAEDDEQVVYRQTQLQQIMQALIDREFELYYQPKVNMRTGQVVGLEALIRWQHPQKGLIPPLDFLPLIEGNELETRLGNWVIIEALRQMSEWQQQGINLDVSVNISSHHIQTPSFFDQLKEALDNYPDVDPQRLQLEILESSALGDLTTISEVIKSCQSKLGVDFALDDFGTGYSSLTHIRDLSANVIKIDQTFVRDLLIDPNDYSIIEGIIGLAHAFNHQVIAEGVENDEQGLMLLVMGCEEAQGYGISRPLPAQDMTTWLAEYKPNPYWLHYGQQPLSPQQEKIILLQLTTRHWYNNTLSVLEDQQNQSVLTECHLGLWFNRLKQEKLFDQDWLTQLETAHDKMFNLASDSVQNKNKKDSSSQQNAITEFEAAYQQIEKLLQQATELPPIN